MADYQVREIRGDDDARKINSMIMRNKGGMVRYRGKRIKNSRVKHRVKYDKALEKQKHLGKYVREKAK